jgi:hypothetical protein
MLSTSSALPNLVSRVSSDMPYHLIGQQKDNKQTRQDKGGRSLGRKAAGFSLPLFQPSCERRIGTSKADEGLLGLIEPDVRHRPFIRRHTKKCVGVVHQTSHFELTHISARRNCDKRTDIEHKQLTRLPRRVEKAKDDRHT